MVEELKGLEIAKWWRNQEGWRLQSGGGAKRAGDCKVVEELKGLEIAKWWRNQEGWGLQSGGEIRGGEK